MLLVQGVASSALEVGFSCDAWRSKGEGFTVEDVVAATPVEISA